jgi:hypothetical protein
VIDEMRRRVGGYSREVRKIIRKSKVKEALRE